MGHPVLDLLATRRSLKADKLVAPGPSAVELDTILTIAARVPDHKKLAPWRFIVLEGEGRAKAGAALADVCAREDKEPSAVRLEFERGRFLRSPLVVAVVSRVTPNPAAPEWEQVLSAGAACMNLTIAANALGYGSCWVTEWYAYSKGVAAAFGLAENERFAGFIYIGTRAETPADRERPALADIVTRW